MAGDKHQEALARLSDFASENRSIWIGETEYDLAKLRPVDLAAARDYVVDLRIRANVKSTNGMTFDPTTKSKMMAEIQCAPLSTWDLVQDPRGRIKLLHLSLLRGEHDVKFQQVEQMEATLQDELFAYCAWVSGLLLEPEEPKASADPLDAPTSTQ